MSKKLVKHAASYLILLVLFAPVMVSAAVDDYFPDEQVNLPGEGSDVKLVETVVNIINVVLGLLGLIAVIIILIGGFKWMTAQGSDDKVTDAKNTIKYGIIGLVIILLAYVIVRVVINAVWNFGSDPTGPIL